MITDIKVNKPEPIPGNKTYKRFAQGTDVDSTIEYLTQGESILINEFYNDGIALLQDLNNYLKLKLPNISFKEQQDYRTEYFKLSNLILLEVKDQKLCTKKSPSIGWLEKFYPDNDHFFLTFPQIQGLNSAWQWYKNGVSMPVLRNKIHPYYGTYFPTRFEHLVLFNNWLKRYKGPKKTVIDVGVGCGVLSLQLIQHGFQKVFATDINPNAIFGLQEFMGTTKLSRKIELDLGNLFGKWEKQTEMIVFNPPWLPKTHELGSIDDAIYYNNTLFTNFFTEAKKRLLPKGKLIVIFSNLAQIANLTTEHPIEKELAEGHRFQLEKCYKKSVQAASIKTKREHNLRSLEAVELWVLTHI
ncbi:methyltransferase [Psychroserpens sp. AS72]|uniref:methyltransferase n=1 Tax=Psychroserpens sp. AS72 TaxID=3135775 RepID=UPI00317989B8